MTMHELEALQLEENKKLCHALLDAGDNSEEARMIVHKLEFISEYKRSDLLEELENAGFEIMENFVTEEGYNGFLFQREDKMTFIEIENVTRELLVLLDEHDARYGGWTTEKYKMIEKIIEAININKIEVAIQKIHSLKTKDEKKCEFLARLNIDGQYISPEIFIPIAKKFNIYENITKTMIEKSFNFMSNCQTFDEFSININMLDINNKEIIQFLANSINKYNIGTKLILELTEDEELTKNISHTKSIMQQLRKLGCKFALDDFGKGYATFDPLLNFDFEYIKLDAVLCKNFLNDERKFYIINLLSEYSKRLTMLIIAEHVENKEEYEALKYMDIDYIQGYYIDKPTLINNLI